MEKMIKLKFDKRTTCDSIIGLEVVRGDFNYSKKEWRAFCDGWVFNEWFLAESHLRRAVPGLSLVHLHAMTEEYLSLTIEMNEKVYEICVDFVALSYETTVTVDGESEIYDWRLFYEHHEKASNFRDDNFFFYTVAVIERLSVQGLNE